MLRSSLVLMMVLGASASLPRSWPEPSRSSRPEPSRPSRPEPSFPSRPVRPEPSRPSRPEPSRPSRPEPSFPSRPVRPVPSRPSRHEPTRPSRPEPSRPSRPQPSRPSRPEEDDCAREIVNAKMTCSAFLRSACSDAETDDDMAECFVENRSMAPRPCQEAGNAALECSNERNAEHECMDKVDRRELDAACGRDVMQFCPGMDGFRATFDCMMENKESLSDVCLAESRSLVSCVQCEDAQSTMFDECMETFERVCDGTAEGQEQACYEMNESAFSPSCRRAVSYMQDTCVMEEELRERKEREVTKAVREAEERMEEADRLREEAMKNAENAREMDVRRKEVEDRRQVERLSENPMEREGKVMRKERDCSKAKNPRQCEKRRAKNNNRGPETVAPVERKERDCSKAKNPKQCYKRQAKKRGPKTSAVTGLANKLLTELVQHIGF